MREEDKKIRIEDAPISARGRNLLIRLKDITTLEQLLKVDYTELRHQRNMGEVTLNEIKEWVHSLGYQLLNENNEFKKDQEEAETPIENKSMILLQQIKTTGIENFTREELNHLFEQIWIEDLEGLYPRVKKCLRYASIDTLSKLLQTDYNTLRRLRNVGTISLLNLKAYLEEYGILFLEEETPQIIEENSQLRQRILSKEQLLMEFNRLVQEKEILKKREFELDRQIQRKLQEMHTILEGKEYVKK